MNPFVRLGLSVEADERAVKRAYAALLRKTRPDEDPQGFQALHEAYQSALEFCRSRYAKLVVKDSMPERETAEATAACPLVKTNIPTAERHGADVSASSQPLAWKDTPSAPQHGDVAAVQEPRVLRVWQATPVPSYTTADPVLVAGKSTPPPAQTIALHPAPPLPAPFDFEAFFGEAIRLATTGNATALRAALDAEAAFWSLDTKALSGRRMIDTIAARNPAMSSECFDVLLAFFDLDHVLAGLDPLTTDRLRRHCHLRWEMLPQGAEALALRMRARPQHVPDMPRTQRLLADFMQPFRWRAALRRALPPGAPAEHADFIVRLSKGHPHTLPPPINQEQVAFWLAAADRSHVSPPRLALTVCRISVGQTLSLLVGVICSVLARDASLFIAFTIAPLALGVLWLAGIGWQALVNWQTHPLSTDAAGWRCWLRLGFVPALGGSGIAAKYLIAPAAGAAPVMLALLVAIARYRRRKYSVAFHYYSWRVAIPLLLLLKAAKITATVAGTTVIAYLLIETGTALALCVWAADLWKQRTRRDQIGGNEQSKLS